MSAPSPRVRRWLRPLTLPASRVYGAAVAARNRRFDRGVGVDRVNRPVISIGNITTGGTGKTPMVMWIARHLLDAGRRPVIAMRGYKARPGERGDEELEYQSILPEVPVLANPDRLAALRAFVPAHSEIDCVLLDDGFQHRRLHRDLDLVLIDASRDTFHDEMLPAGNVREPFDSLARADAVIVTHATEVDVSLAQEIERWHGRPAIAWTRHAWSSLYSPLPLGEGLGVRAAAESDSRHAEATADAAPALTPALSQTERENFPANWLAGKRVVTMFGVGNPKAVIAQVEEAGAKVMADIPAGDHERFDIAKLATARGLCDGLDAMVITRKDWVKIEPLLPRLGRWPAPIVVPQLEVEFLGGAEELRTALCGVVPAGKGGGVAAR